MKQKAVDREPDVGDHRDVGVDDGMVTAVDADVEPRGGERVTIADRVHTPAEPAELRSHRRRGPQLQSLVAL